MQYAYHAMGKLLLVGKTLYDRLEFVESGETCEELSDERLSAVHQVTGEFSSH
jgi:hypothetical protein